MNEQLKDDNKAMTCLRCGGEMFQARIKADSTAYMTYYQFALEPLDKGVKDGRQSYVMPMVCRTCGSIELFAQNPQGLEGTEKPMRNVQG